MQTSLDAPELHTPTADPFAELRRELMNWAEPVIADRILDGYRDHRLGLERTRFFAAQHRRLWRAMILEDRGAMDQLRQNLQDELHGSGLDAQAADAIDECVIEELVDIVLKRFRSSARQVKAFSMILMGTAAHIGASRAVTYN